MSAPIDDLLYDDDDEDDITMGDANMNGGFVQPPVAMGGLVSPPGAVLAPQIIAPPVGVIPGNLAAMNNPIAYTPSPPGPPSMTSEEKFKKLFQLIQMRFPDKYKPVYEEVRTRPIGVRNDMNSILEILKRSLGDNIFAVLCQEVGGFPTQTPQPFPVPHTIKTEPSNAHPVPSPFPTQAPPRPVVPTQHVPQRISTPVPAAHTAPQSSEANDKIKFARQLLTHASACTLLPGQCQVKKCDDIKRFFKHSISCGKGRECNHCEQLRMLVKLHATECAVPGHERCSIPFCDTMRPSATAVRQSMKEQPPSPLPTQANVDMNGDMSKKPQPIMSAKAATPTAPQQTPPPQAVGHEYGRILQMILHCKKCSNSAICRVPGCGEAMEYFREMKNPGTTISKARTYAQVYDHYLKCPDHKSCVVCSIAEQPLITGAPAVQTPIPGGLVKRPSATSPHSPRDLKKPKPVTSAIKKPAGVPFQAPVAIETYELSEELAPTNSNDLRREADVLTHTNIDPQTEKRIMLAGVPPKAKQLAPKRENWNELFQHHGLQQTMAKTLLAGGLHPQPSDEVTEVMGLALHEYLKQALEEMVEIAKQRNDVYGNSIPKKPQQPIPNIITKNAVDILRGSTEEYFTRQMQADQALRSELLEEGRKDESADKDRSNKRRKGKNQKNVAPSLSKKDWLEKDEDEMDIDEIARKDLKQKLLQEGSIMLDGRVNTSIAPNPRRNKNETQVTMEDAEYWLRSQKPYVDAKLFCRVGAARLHSKNF